MIEMKVETIYKIGYACLIVLITFGALSYIGFFDRKDTFNPEEDVCLDKIKIAEIGNTNCDDNDFIKTFIRVNKIKNPLCENKEENIIIVSSCIKWRDKNPCEKGNPDYVEEEITHFMKGLKEEYHNFNFDKFDKNSNELIITFNSKDPLTIILIFDKEKLGNINEYQKTIDWDSDGEDDFIFTIKDIKYVGYITNYSCVSCKIKDGWILDYKLENIVEIETICRELTENE